MTNLLQNKAAFITSGNVGIGRTAALRMAKAGAKVVVVARSNNSGEAIVRCLSDRNLNLLMPTKIVQRII